MQDNNTLATADSTTSTGTSATTGVAGTANTATSTDTVKAAAVATATSIAVAHASILHTIFADLERVIGLAANPAVLALLPAKYQGYAGAAMVIEQVVASAGGSNAS